EVENYHFWPHWRDAIDRHWLPQAGLNPAGLSSFSQTVRVSGAGCNGLPFDEVEIAAIRGERAGWTLCLSVIGDSNRRRNGWWLGWTPQHGYKNEDQGRNSSNNERPLQEPSSRG